MNSSCKSNLLIGSKAEQNVQGFFYHRIESMEVRVEIERAEFERLISDEVSLLRFDVVVLVRHEFLDRISRYL